MKKKLTLSIDDKVLKEIKGEAKRQGWILSKKVENLFVSMLNKRR